MVGHLAEHLLHDMLLNSGSPQAERVGQQPRERELEIALDGDYPVGAVARCHAEHIQQACPAGALRTTDQDGLAGTDGAIQEECGRLRQEVAADEFAPCQWQLAGR